MPLHTGSFNSRCKLRRPAEYNLVFRSPCRSSDNKLLVIAKKNGLNHARIGLAISKKKLKRAVDRNRLKRLIRESFRKNQRLLAGLDIVVTTNRQTSTGNLNNRMIFESLQKHWQKLAACKESL